MPGRMPYHKRFKYPHMLQDDKDVWDRFMDKFPDAFDSVDYDFRVGEGQELNPEWDPGMKIMVTALTQKRIDVIGWNNDQPSIIEVKQRVGLSALGQVLGYRELFTSEFPHFPSPDLMVVCSRISTDDKKVLEAYHIKIEVV